MRSRSTTLVVIAAVLCLTFNALATVYLLLGRPASAAAGELGPERKGTFLMATEKLPDNTPICFVWQTDKPHLCVYRVDPQGLLVLMDSRDTHCDLLCRDVHFELDGTGKGVRTLPRVVNICAAVGEKPAGPETKSGDQEEPNQQ